MATAPTFPLEDQTDEDFFDKLVDDDFGTAGTHSEAADIARAFSNISIGDMGSFPLDLGDHGFAQEEEDQQQNKSMPSLEASKKDTFSEGIDPIGLKESTTELGFDDDDDKGVASRGSVETTAEVLSSNSSVGGVGGSKGTSVKEVQWSAFSVDSQQFDSDLFGSNSDFQTENMDVFANDLKVVDENDRNSIFAENPGADLNSNVNPVTVVGSYTGSSDQQDAQFYGSTDGHVVAENDSQYWENLYPGWKFDSSTGQWYQVDGFESFDAGYDTSTNSQWDGYSVASGTVQEKSRENVQEARNEFISDHKTEISYLQQTAKSVVGVAEDCVTSNISSCYDVSQGITEYPPNMVFDPQYPGWYYDTNTQQWHTLDSYSQTIPTTSDTIQEQLSQDVNALDTSIAKENAILYKEDAQLKQNTIQNQVKGQDWSTNKYANQSMWQPATVNTSNVGFYGNQQMTGLHVYQQKGSNTLEPSTNQVYNNGQIVSGFQSSVPAESMYGYNQPKSDQNHQGHLSHSYYGDQNGYNQPKSDQNHQGHLSHSYYGDQNSTNYSPEKIQSTTTSYSPLSYAHSEGRSSAGRPPHTLISFGFGGKLIVMKDASTRMDYGSQDNVGGSISILSLMEVMKDQTDTMGIATGGYDYFHALCQQSFPGPLVGGNATSKDVNKWIDERIAHYEPTIMDFRKGELLRLLLSLLKISCQHYGKLRSPYGPDSTHEETDSPESAVTKLFASTRKNGAQKDYGSFTQCMLNLPSEGQVRTTAAEVQNLLVSGRRKEALECAQAGQLWGPALVLAAQLGEKFYIDTVKQMAHCQFISGSPLRTLCLLIAGQPADVFSSDNSNNSLYASANISQQPAKTPANGILDDWEENLAIITGNRTKDDELVIVHLGDCLWKEKGEITAAHTCYLVAEANFESYSDSARLCLIGADHWRCPRTYASPEAIQRTELFEYSKVLGNSQFILLPFQPYKLIYAYMLAEVGRVSDSLRYCQASLKLLKNSGRVPEVEMWKSMLSSLEERLRTHQQGGYSTSLAPAKLVGKLFTSIDSTIHRMMGTPPLPPMPHSNASGKENHTFAPKVSNSQSTNVISSLIPSPSTEAISDWPGDRKSIHSRSISEPDFGRSTKQDPKGAGSPDSHSKASAAGGPSRFGRIGSQLLQKTVGWVSKSRQAKLGETNKFYFNEKLKRWVEEGVEPPAEEPALPPPPTMPSFQNGTQDYNISSAFKSNGEHETKSHISSGHGSGIPPISPNPNQFSARGRMGVRSRYVDTFNKGGGMPTSSFQSPSVPSVKPLVSAKFFVPTTTTAPEQPVADSVSENNIYQGFSNGETSTSIEKIPESSFDSPSPPPPPTIQRFPSMGNIPHSSSNGNGSLSSRSRAASWSGGSYDGMFNPNGTEVKSFMPANPSSLNPGVSMVQLNGGGLGDDLHEVEL